MVNPEFDAPLYAAVWDYGDLEKTKAARLARLQMLAGEAAA